MRGGAACNACWPPGRTETVLADVQNLQLIYRFALRIPTQKDFFCRSHVTRNCLHTIGLLHEPCADSQPMVGTFECEMRQDAQVASCRRAASKVQSRNFRQAMRKQQPSALLVSQRCKPLAERCFTALDPRRVIARLACAIVPANSVATATAGRLQIPVRHPALEHQG